MRLSLLLTAALPLGLTACLDAGPPVPVYCPPLDDPATMVVEDFRAVSALLEKRCGTLDCHGTLYRPLRIYGKDGLRAFTPEEYADPKLAEVNETVAGGGTTTSEELDLTRRSICGLEPERMAKVPTGELDPNELLMLQKPLGDVSCDGREDDGCARHKGGNVFIGKGATDAACVTSWLRGGAIDLGACSDALLVD
jgi:hypothetical protein